MSQNAGNAQAKSLFDPVPLPCGTVLKNRIIKSAMSDSLGDGRRQPTAAQINLYRKWAAGGLAASIVGEVQGSANFAEKPGNLVLDENADMAQFRALAQQGQQNGALLWLQLGHAGAMSYAPTSRPKGPSALDLPGLRCEALSAEDIRAVPSEFARTALLAKELGFGGVQIHAAHGFLLSQFLSPLFNCRSDAYGGGITNRMRLLLDVIAAARDAVGPTFPIALKLNSSDQLKGGLNEAEALEVVAALDGTSIDLIDISGGTYFPGAKSASDGAGSGPYFLTFAEQARERTTKPLMLTGGFKSFDQAQDAVADGTVDVVGLARCLVLEPALPNLWQAGKSHTPEFPRFPETPEGGITAWYTMKITEIGEEAPVSGLSDLNAAIDIYEARDAERTKVWLDHFGQPPR